MFELLTLVIQNLQDSIMKTIKYLVLVSIFFFGLQSTAQENKRNQAERFQLIDVDGNDLITNKELIKYYEGKTNKKGEAVDAELMFYGLDRDNNSIITSREYAKGVDWKAASQHKITKRRGAISSNDLGTPSKNYNTNQAERFQLIDVDGNDLITNKELIKYYEGKTNKKGEAVDAELMFYGLDRDNNSIITSREYAKGVDWKAASQHKITKRRGAISSNDLGTPSKNYNANQVDKFKKIDSDKNNSLGLKEMLDFHEGKTNKNGEAVDAELMFYGLDSNLDNKLTFDEFVQKSNKRDTIRKRTAQEALNEPVEVESSPKEPTREERISQREETKRRNAELKEAKRKEVAAIAVARKEKRQQLEQFDREEKKRIKQELEAQRKEKVRLAEEDIKRIKAKVAEERRQADLDASEQREATRLAEVERKEKERQALEFEKQRKESERMAEEQRRAEQLKLEQEKAEALTAVQREARRLDEEKKIEDQRKAGELETQRQEARRLAEMERQQERERLEEERRQAEELVKQKKEAERLAKVKLEEKIRQAEVLEEQRKKQAKIDEKQAEALAIEQRETKRKAREEEKKHQEALLKAQRLEEKRLAELRLEELQKQEQQSEEQRLAEEAKKEVERLAEHKRELELKVEAERKEEVLIKEIEEEELAISKRTCIIIKGNEWDNRMFKDLKEFLEFDFEAADIDVKTVIYDNNDNVSPSKVWSSLKRKYGNVVLLEQTGYNDLGESELHIRFLKQGDDSWRELGIDKCDLGSDKELDKFSKRLAELNLEEFQKQEQPREEERSASEMKKSLDKKENSEIANSNIAKVSIDKPNAFVIIRGKEENKKQFEDLEDHIEFNFMFAKAKSKTVIFNKDRSTILDNLLPILSEENNVIILIDQIEYVRDGPSKYQISIINRQTDKDWKEGSSHSYDLNIKADLKQLSKKITEYLSN